MTAGSHPERERSFTIALGATSACVVAAGTTVALPPSMTTKSIEPTYFVQYRSMARVYTRRTLGEAIAAGTADVHWYGAFDVSVNSGAIVWTWEQRS